MAGIQEKRLGRLNTICETYYSAKGERAPTRPAKIPPTVAEAKANCGKSLEATVAASAAYTAGSAKRLRGLLAQLAPILTRASSAMFNDELNMCLDDVATRRGPLGETLEEQIDSSKADLAEHRIALKPSLGNPNASEELKTLDEREKARGGALCRDIATFLQSSLHEETQGAQRFHRNAVSTSATLFTLLDTTLQLADLNENDDAILAPRKSLKTLMREEYRQSSGSAAGEVPAGKAFKRRVADGLPVASALTPQTVLKDKCPEGMERWADVDAAAAATEAPAPAPAKTAAKGKAAKEERPTSATQRAEGKLANVTLNDTPLHIAAIRARDRAFSAYQTGYETSVRKIADDVARLVGEEEQWSVQWDKLVASLKS